MEFGDLTTIGALAKPARDAQGFPLITFASNLSDRKIRKRQELVSALDGEGIYIHKIQPYRLVKSYAFPPQTTFEALPSSVVSAAPRDGRKYRFTYAVVGDNAARKKRELVCFQDSEHGSEAAQPVKRKVSIDSPKSVVSLHILPVARIAEGVDSHNIVVVYEDGRVQCHDAGLSTVIWDSKLHEILSVAGGQGEASNDQRVEYVHQTDLSSARRGFLRDRSEVKAVLDAHYPQGLPDRLQVFAFVVRSANHTTRLHFCALKPYQPSAQQAHNHTLALTTLDLSTCPVDEVAYNLRSSWTLNMVSSNLFRLQNGVLTRYHFDGTGPMASTELRLSSPIDGFECISRDLVVVLSDREMLIYDTKFNAIQAAKHIGATIGREMSGKKRKSYNDVADSAISLVGTLSRVGLVIAVSRGEILALSFGAHTSSTKRRKVAEAYLIDSIGKGLPASSISRTRFAVQELPEVLGRSMLGSATEGNGKANWKILPSQFDAMVEKNEIGEFDRMFAQEVGHMVNTPTQPAADVDVSSGEEEIAFDWNFTDNPTRYLHHLHREKALRALSWIFSAESEATISGASVSGRLQIRFFPPNTFHWLVRTGQLSPLLINQAFAESRSSQHQRLIVGPGELVAAIADFDRSLQLLHSILRVHPHLHVQDVVLAVRAIIRTFSTVIPPQPDPKLIEGFVPEQLGGANTGESGESGESGEIPGEEASRDLVLAETDAALADADYALSTLESPFRAESLQHALIRLNDFSNSAITAAIRQTFSHRDVVFLAHVLRIELAEGGWTGLYRDSDKDYTELPMSSALKTGQDNEPLDCSIVIISKLLTCAIDAIGISGWVSSATTGLHESGELLQNLQAEVSAALESVHEAGFFSGLLDEFSRFAERLKENEPMLGSQYRNSVRLVNGSVLDNGNDVVKQSGTKSRQQVREGIHILERDDDRVRGDAVALPLGLKVREKVSRVGTGRNGEAIIKSARSYGRQISLKTGKYSFERINLGVDGVLRVTKSGLTATPQASMGGSGNKPSSSFRRKVVRHGKGKRKSGVKSVLDDGRNASRKSIQVS